MTSMMYSRRELLKRLGMTGAVTAFPELSRVLGFQRVVLAQRPPAEPPRSLTAAELATVTAACARILPSDENGPGATEARAAQYIDRSLAGWLTPSRQAYTIGLAALEGAAQTEHNRRFIELSSAQQDALLRAIEDTPFFALLRTHTIQGTFCDPVYGGNANFAGWDLIGYPGVRLAVSADDQRMTAPRPVRRSAYDYAMFSALGAAHAH